MAGRAELFLQARGAGSGFVRSARIRDVLADLDRAVARLPDDVRRVVDFVYSNPDLNRTDCATALGVCSKTLRRKLAYAHEAIESKMIF